MYTLFFLNICTTQLFTRYKTWIWTCSLLLGNLFHQPPTWRCLMLLLLLKSVMVNLTPLILWSCAPGLWRSTTNKVVSIWMSLLLVEDTSPSICHLSFPGYTCCFFYLRFSTVLRGYVCMVSPGEIVDNMFKESLDSVQSFDIFCCYEKTTHVPNIFLPFSHKGLGHFT